MEHDWTGDGTTGSFGAGRIQRSRAPIPRDDFYEWEPTPAAYFDKLRALLDRPVTAAQIARAFRWYSLLTLGTTLDLTDVVPRSDFAGLPPYQTPREEAGIEQIVIDGKDICDLNIERLRESQSPEREARELDELLRQMRRFVHFLMTGDDSPEDVPLFVGFGPEAGRAIEVDGYRVSYRDGDRVYCRSSPMAARLALLCGREAREPLAVGGRR